MEKDKINFDEEQVNEESLLREGFIKEDDRFYNTSKGMFLILREFSEDLGQLLDVYLVNSKDKSKSQHVLSGYYLNIADFKTEFTR